jgi:hypothetical protein
MSARLRCTRLVCQVSNQLCSRDILLTPDFRCTAPAKDLDAGHHVRRSQAHSELLVEEFELGMLWDEYGLVGDIAVRIFCSLRYCVFSTVPITYMC